MEKETQRLKSILEKGELDTSDIILICIKILKIEKLSLVDQQAMNDAIEAISLDYLEADYEGAIKKLIETADTLEDPAIKTLFEKAIAEANKNDNPERLESRRYFETNYSMAHWKTLDTVAHHESLERLAKFMVSTNEGYSVGKSYATLKVSNLEEMEKVIAAMKGLAEATKDIVQTHDSIRDQANTLSAFKDRGAKREVADVGYTRSPGILRANTPVPRDELRESAVSGSVADSFLIKRSVPGGYSRTNVQVPYVNSVSGTAYYLSALLVKFIEQNQDSPTLQQDVDNIVNTFVSYASREGFHSLSEMIDVFQSWEITSVFDKYNIKLHFPVNKPLLDTAISRASDYAVTRQVQRQMLVELSKHSLDDSTVDPATVDESKSQPKGPGKP